MSNHNAINKVILIARKSISGANILLASLSLLGLGRLTRP